MLILVQIQGRRSASGGLTTGPPEADQGLKFEPDTEIGQEVAFCKGLNKISVLFVPLWLFTVFNRKNKF